MRRSLSPLLIACTLAGCRTVPPDDPSPSLPADPVIPANLMDRSVAPPVTSAVPAWVRKTIELPALGGQGSGRDLFDDARRFDKQPMDVTFYARRNETVELYSEWSGIPAAVIREKSSLSGGENLRVGAGVTIPLNAEQLDHFETRREQFHSRYEQDFYAQYAEAGITEYTIKKGDFPYKLQKMAGPGIVAPMWLMEKHNPDVDFSLLQIGATVRIPQLVKGGKAPAQLGAAPRVSAPEPAGEPRVVAVAAGNGTVSVKAGDTPVVLAARHGVSVQAIMAANPGLDPRRMRIGQQVRIPGARTDAIREPVAPVAPAAPPAVARPDAADYEAGGAEAGTTAGRFTTHVVKSGENGWQIAVKRYRITPDALQDANPEVRIDALRPGMVLRVPQGR